MMSKEDCLGKEDRESMALILSVSSVPIWEFPRKIHKKVCEIWTQRSYLQWVWLVCFVASISSRRWRCAGASDVVIIQRLNLNRI
jgi:hypothetical protein